MSRAVRARRLVTGTMPSDVVMLHIGRCGSTVVGDLLAQHESVSWSGEYFNDYEGPRRLGVGLARLGVSLRRCSTPTFGLEVKFLDVQHPRRLGADLEGVIRGLKRMGFRRWIVLERKNYLHRMVSHIAAYQDRVYHIRPGEAVPSRHVALPVDDIPVGAGRGSLPYWFEVFDRAYARARAAVGDDRLEITYEDDIESDPELAYRRVCGHLGIESKATRVRFARTGGIPLSERLVNFDEVQAALAGTRWAWMTEETAEADDVKPPGSNFP